MNGIPISPWKGFTRYLRNALNAVEGWAFVEPFFPTFAVDGMHWGDDLGITSTSGTITAGAATTAMTLSVPPNESWLLLATCAQLGQVAAGQATVGQCRLAVRIDGVNMPVTEAVNGTTRCGAQSLWTPPYPIMLHPGDAITAHFFNGHTGDLTGNVHALRRRLPSASTP